MDWYQKWGKRFCDAVFSATGLIILSPVVVILCLLITICNQHGPIFAQKRVGKDGRPFTLYKLRTMLPTTPDVPTHEIEKAQISHLGHVLRVSKLDELPQLFNVLTGTMSMVGPRPCLPTQTELISQRKKRDVLATRPGITGHSQINGIDMSDPSVLARSDAEYTANINLQTDFTILIKTLLPRK